MYLCILFVMYDRSLSWTCEPYCMCFHLHLSFCADNKNAIVLGGVVLVAVAGVAVAGGNNSGEEGGTSASAAPSASAASGVDPNVAEARAWIAAWKKKHGKA